METVTDTLAEQKIEKQSDSETLTAWYYPRAERRIDLMESVTEKQSTSTVHMRRDATL